MLIPLIDRNPEANDFTCSDGEIDFTADFADGGGSMGGSQESTESGISAAAAYGVRLALTEEEQHPVFNIRIPLRSGEPEKAALLLSGEISRVDCETADRITSAIVEKCAEEFYRIVNEKRRVGLFILPFRVFTRVSRDDGKPGFPSPQAIMLPAEYPPHPEIAASSVTSDTLSLSMRIPVRPCRLSIILPPGVDDPYDIETYASYSLYVPDSKEAGGSLGSVRSATGGNAMGVRFHFLSTSAIKASVAAPEKYYLLQGNSRTGYKFSSKAAALPDYSVYADHTGKVAPFSAEALRARGSDTDPLDWIADWKKSGEGYLPVSLARIYKSSENDLPGMPAGIDREALKALSVRFGLPCLLLTRPMSLAAGGSGRRNARRKAVSRFRIHGLPEGRHLAILLGSDDGTHYCALREFDPRVTTAVLSPPRMWHRLLLLSERLSRDLCLEIDAL